MMSDKEAEKRKAAVTTFNGDIFERSIDLVRGCTDDQSQILRVKNHLSTIVKNFSKRFNDPQYTANLDELRTSLRLAVKSLESARRAFSNVDDEHNRLFRDVIGEWKHHQGSEFHPAIDIESLEVEIELGLFFGHEQQVAELNFFAEVIDTVISPEAKPCGRSRPTLRYLMPTFELIDLWESIPGNRVTYPKGTAIGSSMNDKGAKDEETIQSSSEFIRLGLKMISRDVSAANTLTLIKNALQIRRRCASNASATTRAMLVFEIARSRKINLPEGRER